MKDLIDLGLWSLELKNLIIAHDGSIQNIPSIPLEIKNLYKTVWEIKMKSVIDLAADRQHFVDQSQSLNIFLATPSYSTLSSMHFYGWKQGLKTGMYYLRTKPISSAIKFTVDQDMVKKAMAQENEVCDSCAS
jgi:ribonucleoside-diphosphate reductase subunit M1